MEFEFTSTETITRSAELIWLLIVEFAFVFLFKRISAEHSLWREIYTCMVAFSVNFFSKLYYIIVKLSLNCLTNPVDVLVR